MIAHLILNCIYYLIDMQVLPTPMSPSSTILWLNTGLPE